MDFKEITVTLTNCEEWADYTVRTLQYMKVWLTTLCCQINTDMNLFGSKLQHICPGRGLSKDTHYAGPDHAVSTPIHCLSARESAVTTHPFPLSSMPPEKCWEQKTTHFAHLTAIILFIISKLAISLGEFNKSTPFGFWLCCLDLSKNLNLFLGWAEWVKFWVPPPGHIRCKM